ncbi:MAG: cytochrome P450 [Aestuariivita sp.]|nr:cytochrome P450 [Aestuariivita sp.]MCY4202432.1 cytochrome P450 [Aestuariivita sp.]
MTSSTLDSSKQQQYPVAVPLVTQPWGIWRTLQAVRRNVLSIIPEIATRQPIVSGKMVRRWHMVMDPDALRQILLENLSNYPKSEVTKNLLEPAIGESLFIAEGDQWRWQRRTAAPVFSSRNVQNLAPVMSKAADRCANRIADMAGKRAINLHDEMITTTFDVIADVTFSGDGSFQRDRVHAAIEAYIAQAAKVSVFDILAFPNWFPRPARLVSELSLKETKSIADKVINERRLQKPSGVPDLLDLLLVGEDPKTSRKMNTAELRENLLTFIVAGHETTALSLSWALYLCAFNLDVQDRARHEVQSVLGADRTASAADVEKLPFIRQIIDEALRLYPPAGMISRTALADDVLCGRKIRPGDMIILPIYALHRNHLLWRDPDAFRPDRFTDRKSVRRYAYLPFGDGPRICIGASFALQEAIIILATLLARFRFSLVAGRNPEPIMILTLRPSGGVWLTAEPDP